MSQAQGESEVLSWTAHPAAERPGMAALACAIIALLSAAAWLSFGWEWGAASVVVLVLSLNRFYFRSRFTLDKDCIIARYPLRTQTMRWRDVRRFASDDRGGYLSTRAVASRLDAYRGMHLIFGPGHTAIVERIRSLVRESSEPIATASGRKAEAVQMSSAVAPVVGGPS